ncbi:MAG TPA: hypothetical protein VFV50_07025 [Bdellovibrionales bacterium]|nr:hypothetical protein [Bdellovibrionales bacterium]
MKIIIRLLLGVAVLLTSACAPQDYEFSASSIGGVGAVEETGNEGANNAENATDPLPPPGPNTQRTVDSVPAPQPNRGSMSDTMPTPAPNRPTTPPGPRLDNVINNPELLTQYRCGDDSEDEEESTDRNHKVLICHYPPGNAAARHTICIAERAVLSHMYHHDRGENAHDTLGACEDDSDDEDGESDDEDGGDDSDGDDSDDDEMTAQ